MGSYSHPNAKIMATALFFEYLVYAFFSIYDSLNESGPQYVYINQDARQLEIQNAKARADKKKKEEEEKKKKKEEEKKKKEQDKKEKNDKNKAENNKPEEVKKPEELAKKREDQRNNAEANNNAGDMSNDFDIWENKNHDSITKIIVNYFPKYFLFYVLCVGYCASVAPTDFAVGLTYSEVLVRVVQVYAYYYNNKIVIAGTIGVGAAINFLLIFTGLINKY